MIDFTCSGCGRTYCVADATAGRTARCPCGAVLTVPAASVAMVDAPSAVTSPAVSAPDASATPVRLPMRMRRLIADAEHMNRLFRAFPLIRIVATQGDPPEVYELEYNVKSLVRGKKGNPVPRQQHRVEIRLTSDYPRLAPKCKMLTPIFHPNIDPATICVGDHWTAGEWLSDLAIRIGEMLAYQAYNIKSPLDAPAAMWAESERRVIADGYPVDEAGGD